VNSDVYKDIFMTFVEQLDDIDLTEGYFRQDGATCHTSMALINSFFMGRVISKHLWPPRSPVLSSVDYFLWGYLKDKSTKTDHETFRISGQMSRTKSTISTETC
jgi:hypothetical protein